MKRFLRVLCPGLLGICAALAVFVNLAVAEEKGVALVIGNADYDTLPAVPEARSDTQKLARALSTAGYKVLRTGNIDKTIFDAMFGQFESQMKANKTAIFYYSGHSVQVSGGNAIVPVDATLGKDAAGEIIPIAGIVARMTAASKRSILILDACRSLPGLADGNSGVQPGCAATGTAPQTLVILAGEPGVLIDGDSQLVAALIGKALKPGKDIAAALDEIRQEVADRSGGQQLIFTAGKPDETETVLGGEDLTEQSEPPVTDVQTDGDAQTGDCPAPCPVMVNIPAGRFTMGGNSGDASTRPAHEVAIRAFAMAKYETSAGEWRKCVADGKCRDLGKTQAANEEDVPVYNVTWDDVAAYVAWLSGVTGKPFRLPTEAEWEYAARAGTAFAYSGGGEPSPEFVDCRDCGTEGKRPLPRGRKLGANAFGLVAMSGSIAEWVADCWLPNYDKHPVDGSAVDLPNCSKRVLRGGSWRDDRRHVTVTGRANYDHDVPYPNNGFRVAQDLSQ